MKKDDKTPETEPAKKPEDKPDEKIEPKEEAISATPASDEKPEKAATPAREKTSWLVPAIVGGALLLFLLISVIFLLTRDDNDKKAKSASSSNKSEIADLLKISKGQSTSIGKMDKEVKRVKKTLGEKADKTALAGKLNKGTFKSFKKKLDKDRAGHMKFTAENRALICRFHGKRRNMKEFCKGSKKAKKIVKKARRRAGKWRAPKFRRRTSPPPSSALAERVSTLERKVDRNDRLLRPHAKFERRVGKDSYQKLMAENLANFEKARDNIQADKR